MGGEDMEVEPAWFQAFTCITRIWPEFRPAIERSPYRCAWYRHAINVYYNSSLGGRKPEEAAALASPTSLSD
jgi:hypothetical protein